MRKLAKVHDVAALEAAAEAMAEHGEDPLEAEGEDLGEKLTHVMLALNVRRRMAEGVELKVAFRAEMAEVRDLLTNEPDE